MGIKIFPFSYEKYNTYNVFSIKDEGRADFHIRMASLSSDEIKYIFGESDVLSYELVFSDVTSKTDLLWFFNNTDYTIYASFSFENENTMSDTMSFTISPHREYRTNVKVNNYNGDFTMQISGLSFRKDVVLPYTINI